MVQPSQTVYPVRSARWVKIFVKHIYLFCISLSLSGSLGYAQMGPPCPKSCCLAVAINRGTWTTTVDHYTCYCPGPPGTHTTESTEVTVVYEVFSYKYGCGDDYACNDPEATQGQVIFCGGTERMLYQDYSNHREPLLFGPDTQEICEECYRDGQCSARAPRFEELPGVCGVCLCEDPCYCHVEWVSPLVVCPTYS